MGEATFRAMGGDVHVVVVGGDEDALVGWAERRLATLERRWSRFLPDSDVSQLNRAEGGAVRVSSATLVLVERAIEGWRATGGAFDPTVLPSLLAAGYDESFERVASRPDGPGRLGLSASPGLAHVRVDRRASTVTLPRGVGLDPGGIGKGLAADLVVSELRARGAQGACVNVAGDVRAGGVPPSERGWEIAVEDPYDPTRELTRVVLGDGAVCTSSRLLRNWKAAGRRVHHLIDPATGWPTRTDVSSATVVARDAWLAEVLTKVLFVRGVDEGGAVVRGLGATGLVVDHERRAIALGGFQEVVSCFS